MSNETMRIKLYVTFCKSDSYIIKAKQILNLDIGQEGSIMSGFS